MEYDVTDHIRDEDQDAVFQGLLEYNLARIEDRNPRELAVYYREDGQIKGGLIGSTHGNRLFVKHLWVSTELRGRNIGSGLPAEAKREAAARGCKYCFLDTFSFQAPEFYQNHGYQEVFTLEHYPLTGKRFYFTKEL